MTEEADHDKHKRNLPGAVAGIQHQSTFSSSAAAAPPARGHAVWLCCGYRPPRNIQRIHAKPINIKCDNLLCCDYPCFSDAEDAVRGRDGYDFDGCRIRVEFTRGVGPRGPGGRPMNPAYARDWPAPRRGGPPSRRSNFRVIVEGLPPTGSWQDLKDHLREAGDVCYADVARDGTGVAEFTRYDDMKYAVRKLDDTKFRSHEGETAYIRIREDTSAGPRSRSRSRSRSPRRSSPKYSPRRSRSRSRSPSHSPSRSRSRSRE
ncbi:hypothetical protein Y032_0003g1569 [Ancylostoma ceylanicum]|nr:hypothetical protein Y032_0003g1569 [Ancylostoma ceylanicum]